MCGSFYEIFKAFDTILHEVLRVITLKNQAAEHLICTKAEQKYVTAANLKYYSTEGY